MQEIMELIPQRLYHKALLKVKKVSFDPFLNEHKRISLNKFYTSICHCRSTEHKIYTLNKARQKAMLKVMLERKVLTRVNRKYVKVLS